MGQTLLYNSTGDQTCPVRALTSIIHHSLRHGGSDSNIISSHREKGKWNMVSLKHIVARVRFMVKELKLEQHGIDPYLVGARSLQAGGTQNTWH